jgi:site-specific DNA-adenine methylase
MINRFKIIQDINNELSNEYQSVIDDYDDSDFFEYYQSNPLMDELRLMNFDSFTIQSQLMNQEI